MRLLGPGNGRLKSNWYRDDDTGDLVQHTFDDVEPLLDVNEIKRNANGKRFGNKETFHEVAQIPLSLIHKWMLEEGMTIYTEEGLADIIKKKLNNGEFAKLKTKDVTI